ncbi:YitT family protein [Planococcus sp. N028]|uniref:YitT family protein n=1 Tax=Planococcus shixiaomingii TaxID=3058393 RepID=A0ABT8MZY3_9BACL|nr:MULTISPECIES: YitT family protein [unclassified Planococcus (in: firmicutes)]MDN7240979.1 YitT family protein [Planococcus sp. N028]WKA53233.1 YitT family protein [Planococcus sp. N022]
MTTHFQEQLLKTGLQHKKLTTKRKIERTVWIFIGAVLMAVGLEIFLIPNSVMDGGIVGISILLYVLTDISVGTFIFLLNIPFFIIGYKQIGKTFAISTLFGITILSVVTNLLHHVAAFTEDILLATIFGGVFVGAGIGLVIRNGGALDGSEILAILLNKKNPFSVGEIIMIFNIFIFGIGGFILGWDRAMYSIIAYVIAYKTIDVVIAGLDESKSVWIISDQYREIGEAIIARLGRGVTYLNAEGGFTGEEKKVIFCIVNRLEEAKMKSIVEELDPLAFLAIADINEVRGGKFKKKDIH